MALAKEKTASIVEKFGANAKDTGLVNVQVALLTERIKELTAHCTKNPKDASSRRGLLSLVGKRKSLLKYYQRKDIEGYRKLIQELGLRK